MSLLVLFTFKKTKTYVAKQSLVLILLFTFLLLTKYLSISNLASLGFRLDNLSDTLIPTLLFIMLGTVILATMRHKPKKFRVIPWFFSLVTLYLAFGVLQQIFFQSIFTHTLNELLADRSLVVIFSSIFYSSFHWGWDAKGIKFGILTLFGGVVMTLLFLESPNIILLGIAHAVMASLYYFLVYEGDILEKRLSLHRKSVLSFIYH